MAFPPVIITPRPSAGAPRMPWQAAYPTPQHEAAAEAIVGHFRARPAVASVLLVNSCARGRATADSCLDLAVVLEPETPASNRAELEASWEAYHDQSAAVRRLHSAGRFSVVHLDIVDGVFVPEERNEAAGPDGFELGIGNQRIGFKDICITNDKHGRPSCKVLNNKAKGIIIHISISHVKNYAVAHAIATKKA